MKVSIEYLYEKAFSLLLETFPADQAELLARHLLRADMSGIPPQGLIKLTGTEPLQGITPVH